MESQEFALRIVIAAVLGALVGLDRELSDQPAGLRTHILVSIGAALFTMAGAYGVDGTLGVSDGVKFDPTRVAAQVVTGIGFLGAGAILRRGMNVRGLTTAAGLWVTAAIGLAIGLGFYYVSVVTTLVSVLALFGLKRLERRLLRRLKPGRYEFIVDAGPELSITDLSAIFDMHGGKVQEMKMETQETGHRHFAIQTRLPPKLTPQQMQEYLSEMDGVTNVDWVR